MRKFFTFSLFIIANALLHNAFAQSAIYPADRVVAVVNDGVITLRELEQKVHAVKLNLARKRVDIPPQAMLQDQVLERMIIDLIQTQYATQAGIKIDEAQLEQAILQIAEKNKQSLSQFQQTLKKSGHDFAIFRNEVRQELLLQAVREREIESKVFISEPEVADWIKNQGPYISNEYELAQILISIPENSHDLEQDKKIQQRFNHVQNELRKGISFATVAAKYSSSPEAIQGGLLGWRPGASLPPAFAKLLDTLPIGSITEPIRTPLGIHLFKLLNRRPIGANTVVTQTRVRHILIRTNEFISEADAMHQIKHIQERLKYGVKFAELARLYSEDASAGSGGDLGWVTSGETVPEFEQTMNNLAIGQISDPIRTQFGIHLVTVVARRQKNIGKERGKAQIQMELHQRKAEEQYQNWLAQLRDNAYIDNRLHEN